MPATNGRIWRHTFQNTVPRPKAVFLVRDSGIALYQCRDIQLSRARGGVLIISAKNLRKRIIPHLSFGLFNAEISSLASRCNDFTEMHIPIRLSEVGMSYLCKIQ